MATVLHFFYQENDKTKTFGQSCLFLMDEALCWMNKDMVNTRSGLFIYSGGDGGNGISYGDPDHRRTANEFGRCLCAWMDAPRGIKWYWQPMKPCIPGWMKVLLLLVPVKPWIICWARLNHRQAWWKSIAGNHCRIFCICGFWFSGEHQYHADHYSTNAAYSVASYTKGQLCLVQLEYIMGEKKFAGTS